MNNIDKSSCFWLIVKLSDFKFLCASCDFVSIDFQEEVWTKLRLMHKKRAILVLLLR